METKDNKPRIPSLEQMLTDSINQASTDEGRKFLKEIVKTIKETRPPQGAKIDTKKVAARAFEGYLEVGAIEFEFLDAIISQSHAGDSFWEKIIRRCYLKNYEEKKDHLPVCKNCRRLLRLSVEHLQQLVAAE